MSQQGEWGSGRGKSNCWDCRITATSPRWQSQCLHAQKKRRKKTLGVELCSRFTVQKIWGDNKYSNDSSVPQHPQPKLTTGPNAECQQQTQRSELRGAAAASTAWLNGAGDFPSPALPFRHSQSRLEKAALSLRAKQPVSVRAREGAGVYLGPCIIHMHRYGTKTSTKERPQVPSVPTCFQSIIDGNTTPYTFP